MSTSPKATSTKIMSISEVDEMILSEIAVVCNISIDEIEDVYACTPLQVGTIAESIKNGGAYVHRFVLSLAPSLDLDRHCAALRQIVSLNPIFRTRIVDCVLGLVQVVVNEDICTHYPSEGLEEYIRRDKSWPMDLGVPLLRSAIVERKWVLTMHHAICDHWANAAMLADVRNVYQGRAPEIHAPFKDFVKYCRGIDKSAADSFWASQFSGSQVLFPKVEPGYFAAAKDKYVKNIQVKLAHKAPSRALLPSYIEAAWALNAHIYTNSESTTFGIVLSGRTPALAGLQTTLGPTITTVPVQVSLSPGTTVEGIIKDRTWQRRRINTSQALQYGLVNIRNASEEAWAASRFQTLLNIRSESASNLDSAEIAFESDEAHGAHSLMISFTLSNDSILVEAAFDSSIFSDAQMRRVLCQFEHTLKLLLQVPAETELQHLQLLNPQDRVDIVKWNGAVPEPVDECIHAIFSARAKLRPTDLAVEACDGRVTYGELDELSNRLADELRRRGVEGGSAVPFAFEKSLWTVVAILSILKAGGACIPLDPAHPRARKQEIIAVAKAKILLTSTTHYNESSDLVPVVFVVSPHTVAALPNNTHAVHDRNPANQVAYIMFTSGSTGSPKGVVLEHRNLASSLRSIGPRVGWRRGLRILQFAAHVWDVSMLEIFGALLFGGCVCIPSEEARETGLANFINSHKINWANLTPSVLRTMTPEDVPYLETMVSGGEPLDPCTSKTWSSKVRFIHGWGLCETSIASTYTELTPESPYPGSIGTSVGCATWITDPQNINILVPIGVIGELVIEGPGVARGYLNDTAKTAASFVAPPSWAPTRGHKVVISSRFYRTGDLAKYNADGSICFVGRQDDQVKMRGQRFELGEVEIALLSCTGVQSAFVTTQTFPHERKELVAVLTLADPWLPREAILKELSGNNKDVAAQHLSGIREYVASKLPSYMIPTAWLVVERLPRLASSKLNRASIRKWLSVKGVRLASEGLDIKANVTLTPPASVEEEVLRSVWASVLDVPETEIGRESSFVRLGGDSISGMQIATRCRRRGLRITVATLLKSEDLAAAASGCRVPKGVVAVQKRNEEDDVGVCTLSPIQTLLLGDSGPASSNHFNYSQLVEIGRDVDPRAIEEALDQIVARHAMLHARFSPSDNGTWLQKIASPSVGGFRFCKHSVTGEGQIQDIVDAALMCLDITAGPVLAADLVTVHAPSGRSLLFLVAHGLVIDTLSWHILLEDLETCLREPKSALPQSVSFPVWMRYQAALARDSGSQHMLPRADLHFWDMAGKRTLCADAVQTGFRLDPERTVNLMNGCNKAYNTRPVELLLAAVLVSFHKIFPERGHPALYTEDQGRRSSKDRSLDPLRTVGPFTTLLPLTVYIDGSTPIHQAVIAVKDCYRNLLGTELDVFTSCMLGPNPVQRSDVELLFGFTNRIQNIERSDSFLKSCSLDLRHVRDVPDDAGQVGLLNVHAAIHDQSLQISVKYSSRMAHQDRLEDWVSELERSSVTLIDCLAGREPRLTLSDMPLLGVDYESLRAIHKQLEETGLPASNIESIYPCSPVQQGILIAQSKGRGNVYWDRVTFNVKPKDSEDDIDIERLINAWRTVCMANPILRTVFTDGLCTESVFQQIVLKQTTPWVSHEMSASCSDAPSVLWNYDRPRFAPTQTPHRLVLRSGFDCIHGMVDISHAIGDPRTMHLIFEQFGQAYTDAMHIPKNPDLSEYIAWIQRHQSSARAYWESYLSGARPCHVPTAVGDGTTPVDLASSGIEVPWGDTSDLRSFCAHHNVTIANFMQVAWSVTLHAFTGATSLCFGCLHSGRDSFEGADEIPGPLITMLVCRFDAPPNTNVLYLLNRAKEDSTRALEQAACSLSGIHESLGLGPSSLFNTAISIQHTGPDALGTGRDIEIELLDAQDPTEYPITVCVWYSKDTFHTKLFYRSSYISTPFATDIAETLSKVMEKMVEQPELSVMSVATAAYARAAIPTPLTCLAPDVMEDGKRAAAIQCELTKSSIEDIYSCSPLQQELMASSMPWQQRHLVQLVFKPRRDASLEKLWRAVSTAELAIPALRTRIILSPDSRGPYMYQVIVKPTATWSVHEDLEEYLEWDKSVGVRYGGPLYRFGKIEQGDGEQYAVLSLHRAICDGCTLHIISDAVQRACRGGTLQTVPTLSGFIHHLSSRNLIHGHKYWVARLDGFKDASTFPTALTVPAKARLESSTTLTVPTPPTNGDLTTSVLLQAAWALCLSRLTGNRKVSFGLVLSGRDAPVHRLAEVAGQTTSVSTCAINMTQTATVARFLQEMQADRNEMVPFMHVGLQNICTASEDAKAACAFNNAIAIDSSAIGTSVAAPAFSESIKVYQAQSSLVDVDLVTNCKVGSESTTVEMVFSSETISSKQADIVLHQYEHCISQLVSSRETVLSRLDLLSSYEVELLEKWNADIPTAVEACIHDQVREVARKQPHAPAICSWDTDLTFAQLDDMSDRMAVLLRNAGVQAETIVPLFFEKSGIAVVIMLSVLKAGGAILSLDITHPPSRLAAIIRETGALVVLASFALCNSVKTLTPNTLTIDLDGILALPHGADLGSVVKPSNACYMVYTSGSTGKPKGVVVCHSSIATTAYYHRLRFEMTAETRAWQFLNYVFDVAIGDVFLTLLSGGCICVSSEKERSDDIAGAINRTHSNFAILTPSLATALSPEEVPTLRTVILTGEAMGRDAVETWGQHVCLINAYGPSEASIWSSSKVLISNGDNHLSIGHPSGCRYWIVSTIDQNQLVPIGTPGELLIQGPIVARGYLHQPKITATAFIGPPTWIQRFRKLDLSQRFYKTGDLATQTADGSVIYQGRIDTQVKLRGQRIELGEIEHHLRQFSELGWQFVCELICPGEREHETTLAVFLTNTSGKGVNNSYSAELDDELLPPVLEKAVALQRDLTTSVPNYMVPQIYVHLRRLPLTSSGKTDRKALRDLGAKLSTKQLLAYDVRASGSRRAEISLERDEKPSMTIEESIVQRIWSEALSIPSKSIRLDDDFFACGGNSIRAMRLVAALRKADIFLTLVDVFKNPVLSDMVLACSRASPPANGVSQKSTRTISTPIARIARWAQISPYLQSNNIEGIVKATDTQAFMLAVGQLEGKGFHNELLLECSDGLSTVVLRRACEEVVRHHPLLRTVFIQHGTTLYQVVLKDVPTCILSAAEEFPTTMGFREGRCLPRFHLSADGSLCRRLHLEIHHALYDAISLGIILRDLGAAYVGSPLSEGSTFHDWVSHESAIDSSAALNFWRETLQGSSMIYLAPLTQPTRGTPQDARIQTRVPLKNVHTRYGTLACTLKAAWSLVLSHALSVEDVVFGEISANRYSSFPGVDEVPGPCVNILPVRARTSSEMTFASLITQLQDQYNAAIPHHHLGFRSIFKDGIPGPSWTRFGSIIVFQNHESLSNTLEIGHKSCTISGIGNYGDTTDVAIEATPQLNNLQIDMVYSSHTIPSDQAQWLSQHLADILETIPDRLGLTLGQGNDLIKTAGLHMMPPTALSYAPSEPTVALSPSTAQARKVVLRAWKELDLLFEGQSEHASMFTCGADLVTAMLLSEYYWYCGYDISVVKLLENPSQLMQGLLVDYITRSKSPDTRPSGKPGEETQ